MTIKHEISAGGIVFKINGRERRSAFRTKVKDGNICWLICQHSQHKGWVFPKGLVGDTDQTESMEQAALRETKEEGGVKARIVAPLAKPVEYFYAFQGQKIKKTVYYYLMAYLSGDPANHDWEMASARFASTDKVKQILTYQSDKDAFAQALKMMREKRQASVV